MELRMPVLMFTQPSSHAYVNHAGLAASSGQAAADCGNSTSPASIAYTAQAYDSCDYITDKFAMNSTTFSSLNPSVNCDDLYVGARVCVSGTVLAATTGNATTAGNATRSGAPGSVTTSAGAVSVAAMLACHLLL